jgi:hypothetical protein
MRNVVLLVVVMLAATLGARSAAARTGTHEGGCLRWQARVVAGMPTEKPSKPVGSTSANDPYNVKDLSEHEALEAIGCLLKMENDHRPASFGGNLRPDISQIFGMPQANLAALYYASYIFTENWLHGGAVALRGPRAEDPNSKFGYVTRPEAVSSAYDAYRKWFVEVQKIGLREAREERLDPLSGSGFEWYDVAGPPPVTQERYTSGEFAGELEGFIKPSSGGIIERVDEPFVVRRVEGTVVRGIGDGSPLENVTVELRGPGASTSADGHFLLEDVAPGKYVFKITAVGFKSLLGVIIVSPEASQGHSIRLVMDAGV